MYRKIVSLKIRQVSSGTFDPSTVENSAALLIRLPENIRLLHSRPNPFFRYPNYNHASSHFLTLQLSPRIPSLKRVCSLIFRR
jgi:hypothetical protein